MNNQTWLRTTLLVLAAAVDTHAQPLKLIPARDGGLVRLHLQAAPGADYVIETRDTLSPLAAWEPLVTLRLGESFPGWTDGSSASGGQRFYRAVRLDGPLPWPYVSDFRLLDHFGQSRELLYHSDARAVVLVFADNTCLRARQQLSTVQALRDRFTGAGVVFWVVNANPAEDRPSIAAAASAQGFDLPILKDEGQVVAREFGVHRQPEAVCINAADWTVFYQGAIDDRADAGQPALPTTLHYLERALEEFLADEPIVFAKVTPTGCEIDLPPPPPVSYTAEIAPMLQRYCVQCHSPGNIAPWSMDNYDVVRDFAPAIKGAVLAKRMPPWHADPLYGRFANDLSLPADQAARLIQWINDGAPRGEGPDPLVESPPLPPQDWPLGPPDYVVTLSRQSLPASGEIGYRYPIVANPVPRDAWLRAAVVKPGNRKVVHHVLVFTAAGEADLISAILGAQAGGLNGFFAAYVPGLNQGAFPPGTGKFLKQGSAIICQMHYTATGQPETDQTQIGLYLGDGPPERELVTGGIYTTDLDIPPGAKDYRRQAERVFSRDVLLYELSPHMHYRGSWFTFEAFYPDGARETLLSVPHYDFDWQSLYRLAEPKRLPAGTRIVCRGGYDNSAQNYANPDPAARVNFGLQSDDEMFIGYFNYAELP